MTTSGRPKPCGVSKISVGWTAKPLVPREDFERWDLRRNHIIFTHLRTTASGALTTKLCEAAAVWQSVISVDNPTVEAYGGN